MKKLHIICSILAATIVIQSILYIDLNTKYANSQNKLQTLDAAYQSLLDNYTSLQFKYSNLEESYYNLDSQYSFIVQEQDSLQENYTDLQGSYAILRVQLDELQVTYADLQVQFNQLQSSYADLSQDYEALELQYLTLESQYTNLENEYNRYVSAYQNLREKINQRRTHTALESFITPDDPSVSTIVYSITGGLSNTSDWNEYWDDIKAMYQWIVDNIEYRYDGLYPVLPHDPSGLVTYSTEMWQFPNETLDIEKGDCEDQAILLCSMIRDYCDKQYWAECILIKSSTSGHAAVQIPVSGDKLVIFDPAGNYYSHDIWGEIEFNDITVEINNWLNYWKPAMGSDVYVNKVFSDYLVETFSSTTEYTTWMYNR